MSINYFLEYAEEGNLKKIISLMNNYESNIQQAFYTAIHQVHLDVIEYFIEKGVDLHADEEMPLFLACDSGNFDLVKFLVKNDANVNISYYPIEAASRNGHLNIVTFLIENGANFDDWRNMAFMLASENGHINIVKYLLEKGINIHKNFDAGFRLANENGHLDIAEYIVEKCTDNHLDVNCPLKNSSNFENLDIQNFYQHTL